MSGTGSNFVTVIAQSIAINHQDGGMKGRPPREYHGNNEPTLFPILFNITREKCSVSSFFYQEQSDCFNPVGWNISIFNSP